MGTAPYIIALPDARRTAQRGSAPSDYDPLPLAATT